MTEAFELFKESLEKISDEDFAKILDEMENKELKIEVPQGYEIDKENSTFEKIVFKKIADLPESWENLIKIDGYYVSSQSDIKYCYENCADSINRNVFPTKEEAEACIALAQLCQLRDRYNGGWKPDWDNDEEPKYAIKISNNRTTKCVLTVTSSVLSFKSAYLRDEFLENFRDLIKKTKSLL